MTVASMGEERNVRLGPYFLAKPNYRTLKQGKNGSYYNLESQKPDKIEGDVITSYCAPAHTLIFNRISLAKLNHRTLKQGINGSYYSLESQKPDEM